MIEPMVHSTTPYQIILGPAADPYQPRVEATYSDDPELWKLVIGPALWFQFGVYDSATEWTLDTAGRVYFDWQLELAGLRSPDSPAPSRVLDIGFGWGTVLHHLAKKFPDCPRLDGINISTPQADYAGRWMAAESLSDRVKLFLCNAQDIGLLPDIEDLYDLVIFRGSITHFSYDVLEETMTALSHRVRQGGTVIISDSLYNVPLTEYRSAVTDEVDRLACGYRKSLGYLAEVLERNGFLVRDSRKLPSNEEVIRWLAETKANIDRHFPDSVPQALVELRDCAVSWSAALAKDAASVYSIIATRI